MEHDGEHLAALLAGDVEEKIQPKPPQTAAYRCAFCWVTTDEWIMDGMGKIVCKDEDACIARKRKRMAEQKRKWVGENLQK